VNKNYFSRREFIATVGIAGLMPVRNLLAAQSGACHMEKYRNPETRVVSFISDLYSDEQRYAVSATDSSNLPKPLLVFLGPGSYSNLERMAYHSEKIVKVASDAGESAVVVIPGGRGNESVINSV